MVAALILLIAFGSVVAAGLPILAAVLGLGVTVGLVGAMQHVIDVPEWAPAVYSLIGIGVGIDYALLIVSRFRSALTGGKGTEDALVEAVSTAGRSVLVAGGTVVVAMLGLLLMRVSYMDGVALSASIAVLVGGITAASIDQSDALGERIPFFIGGVVLLALVLLLLAFRAPIVALKAGVMNLLSVGAAFGVVTAFAQGGTLGSLIGIDTNTPVPPFIPVMMFAILFGLSMDYEVFLVSRIRERFRVHGDTERAVGEGLAGTARVITAAGAIMVAVFLSFALAPEAFLKLMGVGMATAILVDATIVRMVLVPALMQLLGRWNWWIPAWLDRLLPDLEHAPASAVPARPAGAAGAAD